MSKPAPPPTFATGLPFPGPSQSAVDDWLDTGFINDKFSAHCERAQQGRNFLRTGVRPSVGQRVELTIFLSGDMGSARENMPFRLSGEVVNCASRLEGMQRMMMEDTRGDCFNDNWRPSTSPTGVGMNGGSLALAHMVRALILQQRPSLNVKPEHLESVWENNLTDEHKRKIQDVVLKKLRAIHGHRVLCEGR